jgi:hypothetical protein
MAYLFRTSINACEINETGNKDMTLFIKVVEIDIYQDFEQTKQATHTRIQTFSLLF